MKVQAHQNYSGLPGVTTVLNILNKPGLAKWANNLGLRGIDSYRFTYEAAEVGTLAHEMILAYFQNQDCDTNDYSANQIARAKHSLGLFHQWVKIYKPKPVLVEAQLISSKYGYGGTLDLYATIDVSGTEFLELVDFKTGSGPWPTHYVQLAAYKNLLIENGYVCENCRLLKLPADKTAQVFSEVQLLNLDKYWEIFLHCLAIYKMGLL